MRSVPVIPSAKERWGRAFPAFLPEAHVVDAWAFFIGVVDALVFEELVEGAVWFEEEVFGSAGHEDFRNFCSSSLELFQKIFRIVVAFRKLGRIAEAHSVVVVVSNRIAFTFFHFCNFVMNEC